MRAALAVVLLAAAASAAAAQAPATANSGAQVPVVNARLERRTVSQGLAREVQAVVERGGAAWVGYNVPLLPRADGAMRTTDWCCGRCRLEPPTSLLVLARVEGKALTDVRSLSVDCDLDAGGMPLVWLDGVNPNESVAWLASLITTPSDTRRDPLSDSAIAALARHATPAAVTPLARLARESTSATQRSRALSALAQRSAADALPSINATLEKEQDKSVRRQAVSALARLPGGGGVPRLMELARTHQDPDVRRQAMLSLGQSRDPRAVDFLAQVLLK